jgi:uncharacterized membrane protein YdfJ with MMPL/SSD domain
MLRLARFSTRRPFVSFAVWLAIAAVLTAIGLGISSTLSPTIVVVPGSETARARAEHLAESNFGPSVLVPVLLEGLKDELDKQGPALVNALAGRKDTRVLSAWDVGDTGASLRPDATHAMLVASVARTEEAMVDGVQHEIDRIVEARISDSVTSYITGASTIDLASRDQALDTARRAELLTLPILFVVLLILLRAGRGARAHGVRRGDDAHELRGDGAARQSDRGRRDRGDARLDGGACARDELRHARVPALAHGAHRHARPRPCR